MIVVNVPTFRKQLSQEGDDGSMMNPDAYIVIERSKGDFPSREVKNGATGKISFFVKKVSDDVTSVNPKITFIKVTRVATPLQGFSTGNFERQFIESVKANAK